MASRNNTVDWDRIEIEYLAGEDSIREIADRHEIAEGTIRNRAKKGNWVRQPKKLRSARNVRNFEEHAQRAAPPPPSDPERPLALGEIADNGRSLVARMLDELDTVTSRRGELEDLIIEATDGDEDDAKRDSLMRAVSLPGRANTLKTLALALKTISEASAPQGKKAAQQEKADGIGSRFRPLGPPSLKAVK